METQSGVDSSQEQRTTEIIRVGSYDILINHRQNTVSETELKNLADDIKDNIENGPGKFPMSRWVQVKDNPRFHYDREKFPQFISKKKWMDKNHGFLESALKTDRKKADPFALKQKIKYYATDSVLKEMSMSREIRGIVRSEEVQRLFESFGIDIVDFVEPLVGIIDREKGEKTLIYKYSNGEPFFKYFIEDDDPLTKKSQAVNMLAEIFRNHGIEPHDIDVRQFLVEVDKQGKKHAKLFDTEMYYRI